MAAGGATGGVLVWDSCHDAGDKGEEKAVGGLCPTDDLRNNGHEYAIPVPHLAAYPDGSFIVSADSNTLKVCMPYDNTCIARGRFPPVLFCRFDALLFSRRSEAEEYCTLIAADVVGTSSTLGAVPPANVAVYRRWPSKHATIQDITRLAVLTFNPR